ncbi:DNA-binding SARP family transcriptional activator [Cryobacterium sp. MP_M5]|uniref:AfsR/SARP family transcriptional regulator n=1 Tax=unclassified Cryobacterium TaxID=2649013 RepID=UPI0018C95BDC|nr:MULTISPECIES: BTAD domain-containing putative transcriptional regulator [unclassified Cryobacterium]MBG6059380.1 DNA-binding SARP family transcriptional activator [Cryobacterium sp. MP_M3]MEC5177641.1 DNA-binding SARP family transcriptional activator [Cryobacterium sp. MP_M5]
MEKSHGSPGPTFEAVPTRVTIQILGSLRVCRGGAVLGAHHLGGPKPRQILEILLLQLGTPVSKERLIDLLWGGNPPAEAQATLESYVCVLRRYLQPGAGKSGPLQTVNGGYVMDKALVDLDLDRFDTLLRLAQHSGAAEALPMLHEALDLAAGPLLGSELLPAWAVDERSAHAARVTEARILAAGCAMALFHPAEAVGWASQAADGDPLNERAWTALVLALELAGRPTDGLAAFDRCRRILNRELGCAPGPDLRQAQVRMLHATADGELSDLLSALLLLHDRLRSTGADAAAAPPAPLANESLREAGLVIDSFLRRALVAV